MPNANYPKPDSYLNNRLSLLQNFKNSTSTEDLPLSICHFDNSVATVSITYRQWDSIIYAGGHQITLNVSRYPICVSLKCVSLSLGVVITTSGIVFRDGRIFETLDRVNLSVIPCYLTFIYAVNTELSNGYCHKIRRHRKLTNSPRTPETLATAFVNCHTRTALLGIYQLNNWYIRRSIPLRVEGRMGHMHLIVGFHGFKQRF